VTDSPDWSRIVADADVLAADLLAGGPSRDVLDTVRSHSWLELVATAELLADAEALIGRFSGADLAADWRAAVGRLATLVDQPPDDHPALAAAYRGNAAHVVSLDDRLTGPEAGAALRGRLEVSVRTPAAFSAVVDPAVLYETTFDGAYPGPDRNPR